MAATVLVNADGQKGVFALDAGSRRPAVVTSERLLRLKGARPMHATLSCELLAPGPQRPERFVTASRRQFSFHRPAPPFRLPAGNWRNRSHSRLLERPHSAQLPPLPQPSVALPVATSQDFVAMYRKQMQNSGQVLESLTCSTNPAMRGGRFGRYWTQQALAERQAQPTQPVERRPPREAFVMQSGARLLFNQRNRLARELPLIC